MEIRTEKKDLYVFAFGLAIIIPYLMTFHHLSLGLSFKSVCILLGGFATVLWVITKITNWPPLANIWIGALHALLYLFVLQPHPTPLKYFFFVVAVLMFLCALINIEWIRPVYMVWMRLTGFIGQAITTLIMTLMFYGVFAPIGIFFRLTKKDYLNRKIEPESDSYWQKRDTQPLDKDRYKRQF